MEQKTQIGAYDDFRQAAVNLVTSEATRRAFDVRQESDALRDRYGRNLFGQSTLVARRLVEAGAEIVVNYKRVLTGRDDDIELLDGDLVIVKESFF